MTATAVFSISLFYGDNAENKIEYFSDVVVRKSYTPGSIAISQLSFQTPKPFIASRAAKVRLLVVGGVGTHDFFISSRTLSNGVYTINCLDRNAFLDENVELTVAEEKQGYISVTSFLDKCKTRFGYTQAYGVPAWCIKLPLAEVQGKTYSSVLTTIATACYGTWCCIHNNVLCFVPCGNYTERLTVEKHTRLDIADANNVTGIVITNSDGTITKMGTGSYKYECLELESPLYDCNEGYMDDLNDRILLKHNNFDEKTVSRDTVVCQCAKLDDIPDTVCIWNFKEYTGKCFEINNMSLSITTSGIFAQLSNDNGTDEIQTNGVISRAVNDKVSYGIVGKNAVLTKFQGYMYSEEEEPGDKDA